MPELTDQEIRRQADWVRDTILFFGGTLYTAYICAAYFAQGLTQLREERNLYPQHEN